MLTFSSILIGTSQPKVLADFYEKVFGKPPDWSENNFHAWQMGSNYLIIGEHSEVKGKAKEPQRVILNFETREVKEEFERIRDLGAKVVREPYQFEEAWIATFTDLDGNYFQLNSPMEMGKKK